MITTNTDYAKAYGRERLARSMARRRQRDAILTNRQARANETGLSLRDSVGYQLIRLGQRLTESNSSLQSATKSP